MKCFRIIEAEKPNYPISLLCRLFGVSRSGFHALERRAPSQRSLHDAWLVERIPVIHRCSRETYRSLRVHAELRRRGVRIGRKRVERLIHAAGLSGCHKRRKGVTTVRLQGVHVTDDPVERNFAAAAPNQLWMSDIKKIATWRPSSNSPR